MTWRGRKGLCMEMWDSHFSHVEKVSAKSGYPDYLRLTGGA